VILYHLTKKGGDSFQQKRLLHGAVAIFLGGENEQKQDISFGYGSGTN
jgi:hypothetical protein